MRRRIATWGPVLGWTALIFVLSAQPTPVISSDPLWDVLVKKVGHMLLYAVTALLLFRALRLGTRVGRPAAWAVVVAGLYAISDEVHQSLVHGRHAAISDVLIDVVAAALAVLVANRLLRRRGLLG